MNDIELGLNIRKIRELKSLSQQNLADEIGTSQKNLSRIEKGELSPTFSILTKICDALKIKLTELLNFNEQIVFNSYTENQNGGEFFAYNNTEIKHVEQLYQKLLEEKERTIQLLLQAKK